MTRLRPSRPFDTTIYMVSDVSKRQRTAKPLPVRFYRKPAKPGSVEPTKLVIDPVEVADAVEAVEPPTWEKRLSRSRDIAASIALLTVPVFILRVWVVASFDTNVAAALISHTTPTQLIYFALVQALPIFVFIAGIMISRWIFRITLESGRHIAVALLYSLAGLPLLALSTIFDTYNWFDFVGGLWFWPIAILLDLIPWPVGDYIGRQDIRKIFSRMLLIPLGFLALYMLLPGIWLPPERAMVDGSPKKLYVLEHEDKEYVVFDAQQKSVLRVPEDELTDRQYCDVPHANKSLAERLFGKPQGRPRCP